MRHEKSMTLKVSNMRTLAAFALVIVYVSFPIPVRAQEASTQQTALEQRVKDQLRRIETLEAALAQLQQEVTALKSVALQTASAMGELEEPFDHAFDGDPPVDPDPKNPAGDLPQAKVIDFYGSLRAMIANDTVGHGEVQNNASRLGLRGEKELFHRLT